MKWMVNKITPNWSHVHVAIYIWLNKITLNFQEKYNAPKISCTYISETSPFTILFRSKLMVHVMQILKAITSVILVLTFIRSYTSLNPWPRNIYSRSFTAHYRSPGYRRSVLFCIPPLAVFPEPGHLHSDAALCHHSVRCVFKQRLHVRGHGVRCFRDERRLRTNLLTPVPSKRQLWCQDADTGLSTRLSKWPRLLSVENTGCKKFNDNR